MWQSILVRQPEGGGGNPMSEKVGDDRLPKLEITGVNKVIPDSRMDDFMPDLFFYQLYWSFC